MKIIELTVKQLNEMFDMAPAPKVKKLKAFLTPENVAEKFDLIVNILAAKLSSGDIDELEGEFLGKVDNRVLKSVFGALLKKLPPETNPQLKERADGSNVIAGSVNDKQLEYTEEVAIGANAPRKRYWTIYPSFYSVRFEKNRWEVRTVTGFNSFDTAATKRFDDADLAVAFVQKFVRNELKALADFKKAMAENKAKNETN